jgi:putative drug exporter of the RND superfamily
MLDSIGRLVTGRPWPVLFIALLFLLDAIVLGGGAADRLRGGQGTEDPSSESALAADVLDEQFPGGRPNLVLMVSNSDEGVSSPRVARQATALAERLAYTGPVTGVTSYWQTGSTSLKSNDGKHALIVGHIPGDDETAGAIQRRIAAEFSGRHGDLEVRIGGSTAILSDVEDMINADLLRSEMIAVPLTLLILVLVFGSVVAAALPLVVALIAITGTNAVLWVVAGFTDVSVFAQNLTTALGLGLAIDYALLIVRRFRLELHNGRTPPDAVRTVLRTAGRTVLFSALTVAAALAAMLVFPLYFLRSFAYAGVAVVAFAAGAALFVLPALLMLFGHRVNALDARNLLRTKQRRAARPEWRGWRVLTALVTGWAPLFAVCAAGLLVVLGLPFLRAEFGMADDRQLPATAQSHVVQQTIRDTFPDDTTGAVDVVVRDAKPSALGAYAARLSTVAGVREVDSPRGTYVDGRQANGPEPADALLREGAVSDLRVHPVGEIEDISVESQRIVRDIRAIVAPFPTAVTGPAATVVDTQRAIGDRLPLALAIIVLSSLLLVFLLTGSVLVPIQAVVLNALSLTAMFGVTVWGFQDGALASVLGFTPTGFVDTSLPVLMFCLAFGLSMDYGVFLLSRIKEEYDRTGDNRAAIAAGIHRTGGIITAAALLLATVLVAIGISRVTNTMMFGWGVALAVVVDATIVRCVLVPATMTLTGRATWWAPEPLRRVHRRFGIRDDVAPAREVRAQPVGTSAGTGH